MAGSRLAAFSGFGLDRARGSGRRRTPRRTRCFARRGVLPDFKRSYGAPVQAPQRTAARSDSPSLPRHGSRRGAATEFFHGCCGSFLLHPSTSFFSLASGPAAARAAPAVTQLVPPAHRKREIHQHQRAATWNSLEALANPRAAACRAGPPCAGEASGCRDPRAALERLRLRATGGQMILASSAAVHQGQAGDAGLAHAR